MNNARKLLQGHHVHLYDLPKSFFQRRSRATRFNYEILRLMGDLVQINTQLQYSGQIYLFNLRSIAVRGGFSPNSKVFYKNVDEFRYHYENFCYRVYSLREKLYKLINEFLALNIPDDKVSFELIIKSPPVIKAGLVPVLKKFGNDASIGRMLEHRGALTHKLYYGDHFDHDFQPISRQIPKAELKDKMKTRKQEVKIRASDAQRFVNFLSELNHKLAYQLILHVVTEKPRLEGNLVSLLKDLKT